MLNNRLELLSDYAFTKLNKLVEPIQPKADLPPIVMSIGDPQHPPPPFVRDIIGRTTTPGSEPWGRYPPINGTPQFRAAAVGWLNRRYRLPAGLLGPGRPIAPCAGTREGLFLAALLAVSASEGDGPKPIALMPNPFYQVYFGAAVLAGAEPKFLPATKQTSFFPHLPAPGAATPARTQPLILCTPRQPQGAQARPAA